MIPLAPKLVEHDGEAPAQHPRTNREERVQCRDDGGDDHGQQRQQNQRRCEALHVPCRLGRGDDAPRLTQDAGFTRQSRAEVPGRMVLDGIPLVRDAL